MFNGSKMSIFRVRQATRPMKYFFPLSTSEAYAGKHELTMS